MAIVCLVWKAVGTNLDPIAIVSKTLCFTQYLLKNVELAPQIVPRMLRSTTKGLTNLPKT